MNTPSYNREEGISSVSRGGGGPHSAYPLLSICSADLLQLFLSSSSGLLVIKNSPEQVIKILGIVWKPSIDSSSDRVLRQAIRREISFPLLLKRVIFWDLSLYLFPLWMIYPKIMEGKFFFGWWFHPKNSCFVRNLRHTTLSVDKASFLCSGY